MSNDFSSFKAEQKTMDAWRKFLTEAKASEQDVDEGLLDRLKGISPFRKKGGWEDTAAEFDAEDEEGAADAAGAPGEAEATPEPAAPAPAAPAAATASGDADPGMPISGTEFATMNFLVGGQLLKLIKDAVMVGVAAKDPESRNLQQLFNKEFFPALVKMTKNPNIDIAEGLDMDEFLQEMLNEIGEPLTRRQQSAKKGQKRAQGGMQRYLKPMGSGKPPMIANKISRALTQALTQKANADSLFDAAAEVSSTIKDPKAKAQYEKSYTNQLEANPEKRVANYKQNVAAFVGSVSDLATKAAAKALAAGGNFAADKAANTAADRQPAEPEPEEAPSTSTPSAPEAPRSARASRSAVARMRNRDRRGTRGVFKGVTEKKKTFRINEDGSVSRINNEKK